MKNLLLWILLALMIAIILLLALAAPAAQAQEVRTFDKRWVAVTSLTVGAAALDAWSTNRNLDRGYRENNLILGTRPAKWNVWALCLGEASGWSTAGYFVKRATRKSPSRLVRNLWMVLPGLSFAGHSNGWIHNVRIYDPRFPKVK